ncbi:hypothetical protein FEM48_Zijuj07G0063800 [Ziziphus jujuba var. spinosa]|uniref:Uncharacterized protein n=1 Tax=Ziziphus jujuba var. spinosa TaxID=714518 RepID=A0A978V2Z9_ZIZJJ|nr:hypothetical protein FEM48_Zijuj07G0063800 [Ziziphus jujuba var. spinosa]
MQASPASLSLKFSSQKTKNQQRIPKQEFLQRTRLVDRTGFRCPFRRLRLTGEGGLFDFLIKGKQVGRWGCERYHSGHRGGLEPEAGFSEFTIIQVQFSFRLIMGPTLFAPPDQIQDPERPPDKSLEKKEYPNGGKCIKSAVMKRGKQFGVVIASGGKKFGAVMVSGGKKSWAAMVNGGKKFGAAMVKGVKKFGPPCVNASVVGVVQVGVALANNAVEND